MRRCSISGMQKVFYILLGEGGILGFYTMVVENLLVLVSLPAFVVLIAFANAEK